MAEPAQPRDVITTGRTGIDLYPLRPDVPLTWSKTFEKDRVAFARRELTPLNGTGTGTGDRTAGLAVTGRRPGRPRRPG